MLKLSSQLKNNKFEPSAQNVRIFNDPPSYPSPWVGDRYFQIWRQQTPLRGLDRYLLRFDRIKMILNKDKTHTIRKFIDEATRWGLFIRLEHGTYFLLPPNRAFNALAQNSRYLAQIHRLSSMLRILKVPHVFICYGMNHYSQLGINEVHLGLSEAVDIVPEVGFVPLRVWRLDKEFFQDIVKIQGSRYSYLRVFIPKLEDMILLLAYTRLPRFEMAMNDVLDNKRVDVDFLLRSAPSLQLGKRFKQQILLKSNNDLSETSDYLSRRIELPATILSQQTKLLQINNWD